MNLFLDVIPYEEVAKSSTSTLKLSPAPKIKEISLKIQQISKKATKRRSKNFWKLTQTRRYIRFLQTKKSLMMLNNKEKKEIKVNVMMSKAIKTRTPVQCHSHHQKMMIKYGSIDNIIQGFQEQIINEQNMIHDDGQEKRQGSQAETEKIEKQIQNISQIGEHRQEGSQRQQNNWIYEEEWLKYFENGVIQQFQ